MITHAMDCWGGAKPGARPALSPSEFEQLTGAEVGVSDWLLIDQAMIDDFATVTRSQKFFHVDVRTDEEAPFDETVANDFLILSLLSHFGDQCFPAVVGGTISMNYGFTSIRFLSLICAGSRVRAHFTLQDIAWQGSRRFQTSYRITLEIEGCEPPALAAEWLILTILSGPS